MLAPGFPTSPYPMSFGGVNCVYLRVTIETWEAQDISWLIDAFLWDFVFDD
jgi:hypothetical protein